MNDAVIVSAVRTAIGKAGRGTLVHVRPESMTADCITEALKRAGDVNVAHIDDLIVGCAMPEAEQGMNVAKMIGMEAGLPTEVAGMTINRYCSSGLQSISLASDRLNLGQADVMLAGGMESMSLLPMGGNKIAPNPRLVERKPEAYMTMGLTAERVAEKYNISREAQDEYAYQSHMRAIDAIKSGRFQEEIMPYKWTETVLDEHRQEKIIEREFKVDEGPRADTSIEALAKLKPVFKAGGTVTAGNSSQTSDGAAMVCTTTASYAKEHGLSPIAKLIQFSVVGVPPEIMGIGPAFAIPKALQKAGLGIEDIDLFEINEAFASQTVAVLKELKLSDEKVNVNGGAIALGHPLGCTGTKLTVQLLYEMQRRGNKYGIVSMCIGGGMGAAGIFEMVG